MKNLILKIATKLKIERLRRWALIGKDGFVREDVSF